MNIIKNNLRIVFAGTTNFSAIHLQYLIENSKHNIVGVITKFDKHQYKKKNFFINPVKKISFNQKIKIYQPDSFKKISILNELKRLNIDLIVVVAYGLLFTEEILKIPKFGCINIHPSILPRWRGPAPIQYSILYGDKITGVTIIKMNKKIDSGDIILQKYCKIEKKETSETLCEKLSKISKNLMLDSIERIANKSVVLTQQNKFKIKYSKKINRQHAELNWNLTAKKLDMMIRAFIPWPVSYFYFKGHIIKVWEAKIIKISISSMKNKKPGQLIIANREGIQIATKKNLINILKIQLPGKKVIHVKDFLNAKKYWFIPGNIIK